MHGVQRAGSKQGGRLSEDSGDQIVTCSDLAKTKVDLNIHTSERNHIEETKFDDKAIHSRAIESGEKKRRSLIEGLGNLTSLRTVRYYAKLQHQQQRSESATKSNHGDAALSSKDSTPISNTPLKRNRCESLSFSKLSSDCIPVSYVTFQQPSQTIKERNRRSSSFSFSVIPQKEEKQTDDAGDLECTKQRLEEIESTWKAKKEQSPATSKYAEERYQKFKNALSKMHTHSTSPEPPQLVSKLKHPEYSKIDLSKGAKRKEQKQKKDNPIFAKYLITSQMFKVPSSKKREDSSSYLRGDDTDQNVNYSSNKSESQQKAGGLTISPPHKTLLYHNRTGTKSNANISPSFKNYGKLKSSNSMAEIMMKARNINESLKQEHRKISNHYSSCQDLSYKCEAEEETGASRNGAIARGKQKSGSSKMTTESATFQKLIKEMNSGRSSKRGDTDRVPQTARLVLKQEDDSPKEFKSYSNSEKKHVRGSSQTQQKDWNKVRVDIQLNDLPPKTPSAEVSAVVSPSKGAGSQHLNKLSSPRMRLGKDSKSKFKFPEIEGKKVLTKSPKKSSSKLPSKMLKLDDKKQQPLHLQKTLSKLGNQKSAKKTLKSTQKTRNGAQYVYGQEKKMFPFNPIYTPSVKASTELPKVRSSEDDAALSSERRPLLHNDIPRQSISPSKKLQPKHEPSVPQLPRADSTNKFDELRGLPSLRRGKTSELKEETILRSDYVSPGMQEVCKRELQSYKHRMHELGPLRESEEEERIYRKVKRMQEVARQLYNS